MRCAEHAEPRELELTGADRAFIRRSARGAAWLLLAVVGVPVLLTGGGMALVGVARGEAVMAFGGGGVVLAGAALIAILVLVRRAQLRRDLDAGVKMVWEGPVRFEATHRGRAQVYYLLLGSHRVEVPAFLQSRMEADGVYRVVFVPQARMVLQVGDLRTGTSVFPSHRRAG